MGEDNDHAPPENVRRKRRIGRRVVREKTPDPGAHQTVESYPAVNVVSMQICPPRTVSAHESKILRRRDRNTAAGIASRSQSQPREAEKLREEQGDELIRIVKRSLSIPRKSDDAELPEIQSTLTSQSKVEDSTEDSLWEASLSRSARNLLRFEEERRQLENERLFFEKERREHLTRYRQLLNTEGKRHLLRCYRKLSDHHLKLDNESKVSGTDEKSDNTLKNGRGQYRRTYNENSTQLSSSDAENLESSRTAVKSLPKQRRVKEMSVTNAQEKLSQSPTPLRRRPRTARERQDIKAARNKATDKELPKTTRPVEGSRVLTADLQTHFDTVDYGGQSVVDMEAPNIDNRKSSSRPTFLTRFLNLFQFLRKAKLEETNFNDQKLVVAAKPEQHQFPDSHQYHHLRFLFWFIDEWQNYKLEHSAEVDELLHLRNVCLSHIILLILLIGFGGLLFRYTEGTAENVYKCEVRKVKRDFIEQLWTRSHNMREEDWKSLARQKLRKFEEELHNLSELGLRYFPGQRSWNFVNSILFCWTVITTIGYGHITPKTTLGQSLTIVYAIIGIPMFLILLADFGKLLTRVIKFLWGYVRRVYYTGTCRKIRKQQQIRDMMGGFTMVYDLAVQRSNSCQDEQTTQSNVATPSSHHPEAIVVDDEFNLPISLASVLLVSYILVGAFVYTLWEDWSYFEAFYFVFISMSTIGFGDFVPNHPIFMMCSTIYLVFGLALTSMFINVVQIKLSDTFKQASVKIGATIGLKPTGADKVDKTCEELTPSVDSVLNHQVTCENNSCNDNHQPQSQSPKATLARSSTSSM